MSQLLLLFCIIVTSIYSISYYYNSPLFPCAAAVVPVRAAAAVMFNAHFHFDAQPPRTALQKHMFERRRASEKSFASAAPLTLHDIEFFRHVYPSPALSRGRRRENRTNHVINNN